MKVEEQGTANGYVQLKDTLDIEKIRKVAGGETYAIIFLKLRLITVGSHGRIVCPVFDNDFVELLSIMIDEDLLNVRAAVVLLQGIGYIQYIHPNDSIHADIPWDQEILPEENPKPKEKKPRKKREAIPFVPPTVEEVEAYCQERGNGISGAEFVASYAAKGWVVGKNRVPMKDWKSAVTTWEINRGFKYVKPKATPKKTPDDKYADYE